MEVAVDEVPPLPFTVYRDLKNTGPSASTRKERTWILTLTTNCTLVSLSMTLKFGWSLKSVSLKL